MTRIDPWSAGRKELWSALEAAERATTPDQDFWRAPALTKLLRARIEAHYSVDMEEESRLQGLIDSLVHS